MTITAIPAANAACTFTGTWSTSASVAYANSPARITTTTGDSVSLAFTGRALYLFTAFHPNFGGYVSVAVDGVPYPGFYVTPSGGGADYYRVLLPLARGLADTAHTAVVTATATGGGGSQDLTVDTFLAVTGAVAAPVAGKLVAIGDSWTYGTGAPVNPGGVGGYTLYLQQTLAAHLQRPITLTRKGAPGDMYAGVASAALAGDSAVTGGMYRVYAEAFPAQPEFLTVLFGVNDLRGNTGGVATNARTMYQFAYGLCCLIEDALDTTATRVCFGTPGYIANWYNQQSIGASVANYERAVALVAGLPAYFPWLRVAQVYDVMDGRDDLFVPMNVAGGEFGLHPNDAGHSLIAAEFARALLGVVA